MLDEEHQIASHVSDTPSGGVQKLVRSLSRAEKRKASDTIDVGAAVPVLQLPMDPAYVSDSDKNLLIAEAHNSVAGHHGINRTIKVLNSMGLSWPKMSKDVTKFVGECIACQKEMAREEEGRCQNTGSRERATW